METRLGGTKNPAKDHPADFEHMGKKTPTPPKPVETIDLGARTEEKDPEEIEESESEFAHSTEGESTPDDLEEERTPPHPIPKRTTRSATKNTPPKPTSKRSTKSGTSAAKKTPR